MDGTTWIRRGPGFTNMRRNIQARLGPVNGAVVPGPRLFLALITLVFMDVSQLSDSVLNALLNEITGRGLDTVQVVIENIFGQTSSHRLCELAKKRVNDLCQLITDGTQVCELLDMATECLKQYRAKCQENGYDDIDGDKGGEISKKMLASNVIHSQLLLGVYLDDLKNLFRVLPCMAPNELGREATERLRLTSNSLLITSD
ncbi:hypothetical protein GGH94_000839 [Coemansia aciculifera]|uniref:Uncharacterized protein n=1 Tax=Coemansia aciculifera TaxID=417176 RepID=A0A9W8ILY0_9FUNG|nr:hypothetical protein GGH94_000839 [Coemansia aciculifera]